MRPTSRSFPLDGGRLGEELEAGLCDKVWTVHEDFLGGAACGVHVARTEVVYGADLVLLDDSKSGGYHWMGVWGWLDRLQSKPSVGDFFLGSLPDGVFDVVERGSENFAKAIFCDGLSVGQKLVDGECRGKDGSGPEAAWLQPACERKAFPELLADSAVRVVVSI